MTSRIARNLLGNSLSMSAAAMLALFALVAPAPAADPIFPTGSLIGLVPPPGMEASKTLQGFEDVAKDAAILIIAQPAAAYAEIEKTLSPDVLKKQGITFEKREPIELDFGTGILVTGRQDADNKPYRKWLLIAPAKDLTAMANAQVPEQESAYPDAVIRAALATLAIRTTVPDAEKLSLLPFTVGDLAGFQIESVLPGRAVMLIDMPNNPPSTTTKDMTKDSAQDSAKDSAKDPAKTAAPNIPDARLFVAAYPGGPEEADDRAEFAHLAFEQIAGLKNVQITMAEPLRLAGQPGFQIMAQAKDTGTDADLMVAQWLRFGTGGFMQIVGIARAGVWTSELARLRTVRDSIEVK
jgi:hypothetical protein